MHNLAVARSVFEIVLASINDNSFDSNIIDLCYSSITDEQAIELLAALDSHPDIKKGITELNLALNQITMLHIKDFPNLMTLKLEKNNLTKLVLKNLPLLTTLRVNNNKLTDLDLAECYGLSQLNAECNFVSALDLANQFNLKRLSSEQNHDEQHNRPITLLLSRAALSSRFSYDSRQLTSMGQYLAAYRKHCHPITTIDQNPEQQAFPRTITDYTSAVRGYLTSALHAYMQRGKTIDRSARIYAYLQVGSKIPNSIIDRIVLQDMQEDQNKFTDRILNDLLDTAKHLQHDDLKSSIHDFLSNDFKKIQHKICLQFTKRLETNQNLAKATGNLKVDRSITPAFKTKAPVNQYKTRERVDFKKLFKV